MTPGSRMQMHNGYHVWNGERWCPPWEVGYTNEGKVVLPLDSPYQPARTHGIPYVRSNGTLALLTPDERARNESRYAVNETANTLAPDPRRRWWQRR